MSYSITVMTGLALGQCVKAFALACVPEFMGGQCVSQKDSIYESPTLLFALPSSPSHDQQVSWLEM